MASPLENAITFLDNFGLFDVVLPFLLVFTIIYAILEKSKILGTEETDGKTVPRRNVNSMVAFVVALFVVVTKEIVTAIQVSLPQIALLVIVLISFMMLAGTLTSGKDPFSFEDKKGWKIFLMLTLFIAILAIFLNSIDWLDPILDYIEDSWDQTFIVSLIFMGIIIGVIFYVVRPTNNKGKEGES